MSKYLDTNILARFYEGEERAKLYINKLKSDGEEVIIPAIVIEEMVWLMTRFYKAPKNEIIDFQRSVIGMTGVSVVYEYSLKRALKTFEEANIKFNDCVVYSYTKKGDEVVSYDRDFDKLPDIKRVEP